MYKIIDLSVYHQNNAPESASPVIEHSLHADGVPRLAKVAGLQPEDFPSDTAMATDIVHCKTHSGTHVDAPFHYGPECEGKPAKTIDQVPLEWLYGPGVCLDMRHKEAGAEITIEDMQKELDRIGYTIKPGDIVLLQTGADKYWESGKEAYMKNQSGLDITGLDWLLDQGVKSIGIDAWTLDRPVASMAASFRETGDSRYLWPSHYHGRVREYLQIEKLANLDKLPKPYGFLVSALPVKLQNCSAGWCRAVAIFPEE